MSDALKELIPLISVIGGLGGLGVAIAVLMKVGVDKTDIKIGSADKVMIGQDRFINELKESLQIQTKRVDVLSGEMNSLRSALLKVTNERDHLRQENARLSSRVAHLEKKVTDLQNGRH